ncbi:MAG: DUF998 domain-containing protein [Candidatus Thorarchaeota archaeon]|nr:MAG: DUF998 domain-containing protein [Candidatus Thorarchaeota archaeon]
MTLLPGYSWFENALSDLGSWYRTDLGELQVVSAVFFNGGLIVTGLFLLYYSQYFIRSLKDLPTKVAMIAFACTCVFLVGVGIFSEDFRLQHFIAALSYFLTIPIALGLVGLVWLRHKEIRWFAVVSLILAFISYIAIFQSWASIAFRELGEALIAIGWLWTVDFMHYTGRLTSIVKPVDTMDQV